MKKLLILPLLFLTNYAYSVKSTTVTNNYGQKITVLWTGGTFAGEPPCGDLESFATNPTGLHHAGAGAMKRGVCKSIQLESGTSAKYDWSPATPNDTQLVYIKMKSMVDGKTYWYKASSNTTNLIFPNNSTRTDFYDLGPEL